ncbi:hypothetical protein AAULR_26591, partial [Lacticaseibacillus rhamnosus MTCC 5462]
GKVYRWLGLTVKAGVPLPGMKVKNAIDTKFTARILCIQPTQH